MRGNVIEYDFLTFWFNVIEYECDYTQSMSTITITTNTEYDYSISDFRLIQLNYSTNS